MNRVRDEVGWEGGGEVRGRRGEKIGIWTRGEGHEMREKGLGR